MAAGKQKNAEGESLDDALEAIRGDGLNIGNLAAMTSDVEAMTTGNLIIDALTDVGGLPRGRIVELYGPPSSGKTTTALQAAAAAQARGETVAFFDYEQALDIRYCAALGLDVEADTFIYAQPDTLESGFGAIRRLVRTGQVSLVVVDSIAAITTESELEAGQERRFNDKALLLAQAMRQLVKEAAASKTCLVFLNHLMDVVDLSPMGQRLTAQGIKRTTTPGGKALKYYASVRIEYRQVGKITTPVVDPITGEKLKTVSATKVRVKVVKNKVGVPFREAEVVVRFGHGFSQAKAALDVLQAHKAVRKQTGGWFEFRDERVHPPEDVRDSPKEIQGVGEVPRIRGEENVLSAMERDAAWLAACVKVGAELIATAGDIGVAEQAVGDTGEVFGSITDLVDLDDDGDDDS